MLISDVQQTWLTHAHTMLRFWGKDSSGLPWPHAEEVARPSAISMQWARPGWMQRWGSSNTNDKFDIHFQRGEMWTGLHKESKRSFTYIIYCYVIELKKCVLILAQWEVSCLVIGCYWLESHTDAPGEATIPDRWWNAGITNSPCDCDACQTEWCSTASAAEPSKQCKGKDGREQYVHTLLWHDAFGLNTSFGETLNKDCIQFVCKNSKLFWFNVLESLDTMEKSEAGLLPPSKFWFQMMKDHGHSTTSNPTLLSFCSDLSPGWLNKAGQDEQAACCCQCRWPGQGSQGVPAMGWRCGNSC